MIDTAVLTNNGRRLTREFGQNISFSRVTEGTFVPNTGAVGSGSTITFMAYGSVEPTPNQEVNGTTVLQDDLQVFLESNVAGDVPAVGDVATISGIAYRVLSVRTYVVLGVNVLFKLQLRI